MKRMHVHAGVKNLDQGISFYSALFGADPVKTKGDYAKWMLDDPRINFAISTRVPSGIDHLGIQVDEDGELGELRDRLGRADALLFDEGETECCYARSDKTWVEDPAGIAWETFRTMEDLQLFAANEEPTAEACCTPETKGQPGCCVPSEKTVGCCA
jgi:catechol 2,3-dioxygenase-like lactoylglutathione lyase family enzyme